MTSTFLEILNNATGQLASGITDSATSLVLGSGEGASFPSDFPFHISINNEIIEVGARSTDTLSSLVRAREGTTAAAHSASDAVELRLTAKIIDDITSAVNIIEDATVDHDSLDNVTVAQHHPRYLDSEAVAAVNVQDSVSHDILGDVSTSGHHVTSRPYTYSITFGWDSQSPQVFAP